MNIKGSKKKKQVLTVNIFEQQEIIAKAEAANHGLSSPLARSFRATCTRKQGHRHGLKATSRFTRDITPR